MRVASDQGLDAIDPFPSAAHGERSCREQLAAPVFGQVAPGVHVHDAGLILQRDKHGAAGGGGVLGHCDQAGGAQVTAVLALLQVGAAEPAFAPQLLA